MMSEEIEVFLKSVFQQYKRGMISFEEANGKCFGYRTALRDSGLLNSYIGNRFSEYIERLITEPTKRNVA